MTSHHAAAFAAAPSSFSPSDSNQMSASSMGSEIPCMATQEMKQRLPALDDDADIGELKTYIVPRDNLSDLRFQGTLIASAAPPPRKDRWREYRVYKTSGGNYIFSRIGRSLFTDEVDKFEAEVCTPSEARPVTLSELLGSASVLPKTPMQEMAELGVFGAASTDERKHADYIKELTKFFGFDSLAKTLYAKLGIDTATSVN